MLGNVHVPERKGRPVHCTKQLPGGHQDYWQDENRPAGLVGWCPATVQTFTWNLVPHYFNNWQVTHFLIDLKLFTILFPVWLRNRLLSAGLEPVLSQTEKACIASNYRQFSTNIKIIIIKLKPSFVSPGLRPRAADKTGFNLKIFLLMSAESCL